VAFTTATAAAGRKVMTPAAKASRAKALQRQLEAVFLEKRGHHYAFEGKKDGEHLRRLLSKGSDEEILRRWRAGLDGKFDQRVNTIAQLDSGAKWNALAGAGPPRPKPIGPAPPPPTGWQHELAPPLSKNAKASG
jgi:hypothetical protein